MNVPCPEEELNREIESLLGIEMFSPKSMHGLRSIFTPLLSQIDGLCKIILIAGTNGKGETAHSLDYLLRQNGQSVGLWTSPHIVSVCERFRFCGEMVGPQQLLTTIREVWIDLADDAKRLSYYEFLFYVFCRLALVHRPQYLILEVGLGGRWDAVNLFTPCLSLITSIGRDHMEYLGPTLQHVLMEKFGICRPFVPLISFMTNDYLGQRARVLAKYFHIPYKALSDIQIASQVKSIYWKRNQLQAYMAFKFLCSQAGIDGDDKQLMIEFEKINFPTFNARREELICSKTRFIFIGAHNMEGMREAVYSLATNHKNSHKIVQKGRKILVSFSRRTENEMVVMLKSIINAPCVAKEVILTSFVHPKAAGPKQLGLVWHKLGNKSVRFQDNFKDCILHEINLGTPEILVLGSYYFIGEVKKYLSNIEFT